jgi:hypothetical protein
VEKPAELSCENPAILPTGKDPHFPNCTQNIIADMSGTMQFVYDLRVKGHHFISDDELDAGTVILHFGAY